MRHQSLAHFVTGLRVVRLVKIAVGGDTAHVVHGRGDRRLYASVDSGRIDCHAAPAANSDDADAFRINIVACREEIYGCHEIFGIDIRAIHVARLAARFAGEARVKSDGQESAFSHVLRVKPRGLFLDGTERPGDCDGGELAVCLEARVLGHIQIRRKFDTEMVLERDLGMFDLFALGEYLVPFGGERELVHIVVLCRFSRLCRGRCGRLLSVRRRLFLFGAAGGECAESKDCDGGRCDFLESFHLCILVVKLFFPWCKHASRAGAFS